MNEAPKELTGLELLAHAAKLHKAVEAGKKLQFWLDVDGVWLDYAISSFTTPWKWRVKPEKIVGYVNVYPEGSLGFLRVSKEAADRDAGSTRHARVRIEYYPGQFDD